MNYKSTGKKRIKQIITRGKSREANVTVPQGTSHDLLYSKANGSNRWKTCYHVIERHSLSTVAHSWHLAGNSFIVRCHVTMN